MKTFFFVGALFLNLLSLESWGASHGGGGPVHVGGYTKANGTYVAPHYRSAPDHTTANNWSTKGNVNPYTGKAGTKNPAPSTGSSFPSGSYAGSSTEISPGSGYEAPSPKAEYGTEAVTLPAPTARPAPAEAPTFIPPGTMKVSIHEEDSILEFQKKSAASGFSESQYALGMRYLVETAFRRMKPKERSS